MMESSGLKPKLQQLFQEYAEFHQHPLNQLTHKVAIPLIVFHIVAMLQWVVIVSVTSDFSLTLAHLAYLAVIAWYASLDLRLAVWAAVLFALCFPMAALTPPVWVWVVAVCGWGIQLAGHLVWEKRTPAFVTNLLQALVGPLYFIAIVAGVWSSDKK